MFKHKESISIYLEILKFYQIIFLDRCELESLRGLVIIINDSSFPLSAGLNACLHPQA